MKLVFVILLFTIVPTFMSAHLYAATTIELTGPQVLHSARALMDRGDTAQADEILRQTPPLGNAALEVERWFLLGQVAARRGDYDGAIKIFREILDRRPELARIRFELALMYMQTEQWYRADYHMRLAAADDTLPPSVQLVIKKMLYVIRQNKNWNVWFNFGAAPDNNINAAVGGAECIMTIFGPMCRDLPSQQSAIGYNFVLGGNYEFKLSDGWRWKSDANVYMNVYDMHDFDDLYLAASTGPRYVWRDGDVWTAATATRRWYGWDEYSWGLGGKIDANYDFTRKLAGGIRLSYSSENYDEFGEFMDGDSYGATLRLSYSIDATKYLIWRGGVTRDVAVDPVYSNWRENVSIGFGMELPWGFNIYLEPGLSWANYDAARWVVSNGDFAQIREHNFTQTYSVSLSNNNLGFYGFVPTLTFSYTTRDSNIWQREFSKTSVGITLQQRF